MLGLVTGGTASLPVRISQGGSVKKTVPTPVRRTHESGGSHSDFSASGSFNLASLAGSKNYRRRLGNVTGGTASLPVRIIITNCYGFNTILGDPEPMFNFKGMVRTNWYKDVPYFVDNWQASDHAWFRDEDVRKSRKAAGDKDWWKLDGKVGP